MKKIETIQGLLKRLTCKVGDPPPGGNSKDTLNSKKNSIPFKNTQESSVKKISGKAARVGNCRKETKGKPD